MDTARSDREEFLCDAFAAALLLPRPLVLKYATDRTDLATLCDLARVAGVSLGVAVRRIAVDLRMGESSSWYVIRARVGALKVSTIRRRPDARSPTQDQLRSLLLSGAPIRSIDRMCSLLSSAYPGHRLDVLRQNDDVWLRMTPSGPQ